MSSSSILVMLLATSVLSALLPVVNAEALVLATVALLGADLAVGIAAVAATGQMIGKASLYVAARGLGEGLSARSARAERLSERFRGRPRALALVCLVSAVIGLPPFYVMSIGAGLVRLHAGVFLATGLLGRFARFYALALMPGLL
ncbi:MAG TPA: hypothetical protein VFQ22_04815 [Longimicrobiales bacterium]|nr:hypothetical protein [Longimicrobiales bacterium]